MKRLPVIVALSYLLLLGCSAHSCRIRGQAAVLLLRQPDAREVLLACSLDGYTLRPARPVPGGWEVTLPADRPFVYFYRVDGRLLVPDCRLKEQDDFGAQNCIFDPDS